MNAKAFLLLALLVLSQSLFSQDAAIYSASPVYVSYNISELMNVYDNEVHKIVDARSEVAGSPYVFNDFIEGTVFSKVEQATFHINLNMNAVTNLFEFIYEGDVYQMPNFAFDSVIVGQSAFIPVSIVENDKVNIFAMELLASDSSGNHLLKRYVAKFMDRVEEKPFIDAKPSHYKHFPPHYYLYLNHALIPLDNLRRLSDYEGMPGDINSYVKRMKIRRKDEDDLRQLFYYIANSKE